MNWYKKAELKNTDDIVYDIFRAVEDAVGGNWRVVPITEQKDSKVYWLQRIVSFALYGKSIIKQGDSFAIYIRIWVKRASGKVVHPWDGSYEGSSSWDDVQLSKAPGDFNEQVAEHQKRWKALYNMKPDDGSGYDSEYGNRLFEIQIKLYGSKPDISGKEIPHDDRISITSELDTPNEIASHIKSEINRFYFGGEGDNEVRPFDPTSGGYVDTEQLEELYNPEGTLSLTPNFAYHRNWYKKAQQKELWQMTREEYDSIPLPQLKPNDVFYVNVYGKNVEVIQNPTGSDLRQLSKEVLKDYPEYPPNLRSTQDENGNKYYWKAYDAIHAHIEPLISKVVGEELDQNAGVPLYNRIIYDALEAGKPVPSNVFDAFSRHYPDVARRYQQRSSNELV